MRKMKRSFRHFSRKSEKIRANFIEISENRGEIRKRDEMSNTSIENAKEDDDEIC